MFDREDSDSSDSVAYDDLSVADDDDDEGAGVHEPSKSRAKARQVGDEPPTKLAAGSVIPDTRLEIVRWLGEGGMGTVFEVRHLDIDRHFAAKLLHRSESVARARRFRREAKTIGNIGSPWIVDIYDFKELPDGRLMYLMELVAGPTLLARQAEAGAFDLARLIGLARQICKGLCDAHSRGFIHRDIKPENIMIATDASGREHVKIVDFGLAGLLAQPNESSRAGTPTYMSPEQCKGEPADARADIYALGVTLYELGSGTLPFIRNDPNALREDHIRRDPIPPSEVRGAPALPPSFDALVLRCMAKRPEQRFADAAELEAALIELQLELELATGWDELPVPKLGDSRRIERLERGLARIRRDQARERGRRHLLGALLAAIVVLSSAIGWYGGARTRAAAVAQAEADLALLRGEIEGAVADHRWVYPPANQPDADTAYKLLVELEALELDRADAVGEEIRAQIAVELLALADGYWEVPGGRAFAREFYAHALVFDPRQARALARAGLSPTAVESLRDRAGTGRFDDVELSAVETLSALAEPDDAARLAALREISSATDKLPSSVSLALAQVIDDLEARVPGTEATASATPDEILVENPAFESAALDSEGTEPASDPSPKAAATKPKARPSSETGAATAATSALIADAEAALRRGDRKQAERLYQRTLELDARHLEALVGLHRLHFDRGAYKEALAYAQRALAGRPRRSDLNLDVADSCMKVLDYTCARRHYERALALGDERAAKRLQLLDDRLGSTPEPGPHHGPGDEP